MAHDDVNDLKQRVSNQSVQIMRLEEKVRSLTRERDHWIAEAAEAKAVIIRAFAEAATDHVREICGEKVEGLFRRMSRNLDLPSTHSGETENEEGQP